MRKKTSAVLSFLSNLLIVFLTAYSVARFFVASGEGNMQVTGAACFRYFTVDSNILAAVASLLLLPCELRRIRGKSDAVPLSLSVFKLAGTVAVTITFTVVLVFLGPLMGYGEMFAGVNLYLHAVCPILAIVSFLFWDGGGAIGQRQGLPALLPAVVYGLVYFVMVVILTEAKGGWPDFYSFNRGGLWPVSMAAIFSVNALFVRLLRKLHNRSE